MKFIRGPFPYGKHSAEPSLTRTAIPTNLSSTIYLIDKQMGTEIFVPFGTTDHCA